MIEEFMIENEQKHYHALELDKVLSMLAQETSCEDAAERAHAIVPQSDLKTVRTLLQETDDAYRLMGSFGSPSFGGLNSCENSLRRAAAGGTLTMGCLLYTSREYSFILSFFFPNFHPRRYRIQKNENHE